MQHKSIQLTLLSYKDLLIKEMFVINFDFSGFPFIQKLIAINTPVLFTELITYPLQRVQTQLIYRNIGQNINQFGKISKILTQMFRVEGFPKCYHGLRYSLDYSMTQMTFKFFLFDHIVYSSLAEGNKLWVYMGCMLANIVGTMASQSAFNYQTITSSLQPSRSCTNEELSRKLIAFTDKKSAFKNGLKYTLPFSIINSLLEVFIITKLEGKFLSIPQESDNYLAPKDPGYAREELIIASIVLFTTSITNHFVFQRQIQECFDLKQRYNFWKGFSGTLLRNMSRGIVLYSFYYYYFDWLLKGQIQEEYTKKKSHNELPEYYQSRGRTVYPKDT